MINNISKYEKNYNESIVNFTYPQIHIVTQISGHQRKTSIAKTYNL